MTTKKKQSKKNDKALEYWAVIGNEGYGLYYGKIRESDDAILKRGAVRVYECRHIRYWYGGSGGISSLAAWGPCGPRAKESRIGAPCPSSLVTQVRAIHSCSAEAVDAFAAIEATR